jgi:very-short-patch-repair endonuclease
MDSSDLIEVARELRKKSTPAEKMLWGYLRNNQLGGIKFYRQHPVCGFIIDFYSKKARLGIELDGAGHLNEDQKELDHLRTTELKEYGIFILRFWNREVMDNTEKVLERIYNTAKNRLIAKPKINI